MTAPHQHGTVHESTQTILAHNLVIARAAAGLTQQQLAVSADIARATVAQIEAGCSDPRLSTVKSLAQAVGVSPPFLLLGRQELLALIALADLEADERPRLQPTDLSQMRALLASGMLRDRLRAGRLAASVVRRDGATAGSVVCAAILSAIEPGDGTVVGMLLGQTPAVAVVANDVHLNIHSSKSS